MRRLFAGLTLAASLLVAGCATPPQAPIRYQPQASNTQGLRIGVAMSTLPKADTAFPGAGCLLCLATASIANAKLTDAVHTWPTQDFAIVRDDLAKVLQQQGVEVVMLKDIDVSRLPDRKAEPDKARKDFSAWRASDKIDKLLVVQIDAAGVTRNYSAYVPTGAPRATVKGTGYLIDLSTHQLEWYWPLNVSIAADGEWDEPPKFPGLTNAYFQAIEGTLDQLRHAFAKKP